MKQLAAALMVIGAALLMGGASAHAYPPGAATVTVIRGAPGVVNTEITVEVRGCTPGEDVRFRIPGRNPVVSVCTPDGVATARMFHPGTPGTYTGTAELLGSGVTLPFTIVTTADPGVTPIPPTGGGEGANTMIGVGVGAVLLGGGLIVVARQRQRRDTAVPA